jgi:glutamate 5-kinase
MTGSRRASPPWSAPICLVLLSDIDGLYTAPPKDDPRRDADPGGAAHHAGDRGHGGRGGVRTVARRHAHQDRGGAIATTAGTHMVIASGQGSIPWRASPNGAPCTWFLTPSNPVTARKIWIAGSLEPRRACWSTMPAPPRP